MAHDHSHAAPVNLGPAFRWAVGLNTVYVIIEAAVGFSIDSLALIADAAHNLTDVAGLLIAWGASVLASKVASGAYTFGYGRATILAAMLNAVAILIGVVLVIWEAAHRLQDPIGVSAITVLLVALIGIGVNTGSALLFVKSQKSDLNAKGAFLHMATDAAVSGAVVLGATGIIYTGWYWLDPVIAIAVSMLISITAWRLLREALHLELDGVPESVNRQAVEDWLGQQPGVEAVHDLHIWALSTTRIALAVHLVWQGTSPDVFLDNVSDELEHRFSINHTTIQLEHERCERSGFCSIEVK